MPKNLLAAAAATTIVGLAASASADILIYTVDLDPLNGSNVEGNGVLTLDTDSNELLVELSVFNVEPGELKPHAQHIHGLVDPNANSVVPPPSADADGDGYIEVGEGVPSYGPVLIPLVDDSGNFPTTTTGFYNFTNTYDLDDSAVFAGDFDTEDLFPLFFREIVIHGQTVATGEGAGTGGEVNGTGGYKASLPVAAGEIVGPPIPEPTSLALLGTAGLMALRRRRA